MSRQQILLLVWTLSAAMAAGQQQPPGPPGDAPKPKFARLPTAHGQGFTCPSCNLKGLDISTSNLTNANLINADLTSADLTGVTLGGASLEGAILVGANLTNAQMGASNQGPVDLSNANLSGATLTGANLADADLEFADLSGADFSGVDVSKVSFGPHVKTGVHNGKKTSFRGATVSYDFHPDSATADLTGVRRVKVANRPRGLRSPRGNAGPTVACGNSDLSQLTSYVYVSSGGTDGPSCGTTHGNACKTITQGLQNCAASGCGVLVDYGEYPQTSPLTLRAGVNVYGGCIPTSQSGSYYSLITAAAGGAPAVSAQGINVPTSVQNFKISGSAVSGATGAPSTAMSIAASSALSITNCEFYASTGGQGAPGSTPAAGTAGGAASGQSGGTVAACPSTTGGQGSVQQTVSLDWWSGVCTPSCSANGCWGYAGWPGTTGNWAGGGQWGNGNCAGAACPVSSPGTGNSGNGGTTASCGGPGLASTNTAGSFSGGTWTGSVGGSGSAGGNGGGGGGGGAGGYQCGYCFGYIEAAGNTGGGGGAGGCAGGSGPGGQQGGASFAIVNSASTLTIAGSRIVGNQGGTGGLGGGGSNGGGGGTGAGGASGGRGANGGPGGNGGGGGGGGGAAGGNGGPSVLIALVGTSAVNATTTSFYLGSSGATGGGGTGGSAPNSSCTGTTGGSGVLGLVAQQQKY